MSWSDFVRRTVNRALSSGTEETAPLAPARLYEFPPGGRGAIGSESLHERDGGQSVAVEADTGSAPPEGIQPGEDHDRGQVVTVGDLVSPVAAREREGGASEAVVVTAPPLPSSTFECRNAPFHVKGRYCKLCGSVPE